MRQMGLLTALLASCLLAAAYGATLKAFIDMSADAPSSLKSISDLLSVDDKMEDLPAIAAIRFKVLPSDAPGFEKAWRDMAKQVESDDTADVFELKSTINDNLFYFAYAEWPDHKALHDYFSSDAFNDFAKFVDDRNIRWEQHELINMSEEMDEEKSDEDQGDQQEENENTVAAMVGRGKRHSRRCSRSRSHKGGRGGGDQGGQGGQGEDWDKYIPREHRKYIPKKYLPKHKHHGKKSSCKGGGRRAELSMSSLSLLADPSDDEQVRTLYSELHKRKDMAHMMMVYEVPPGQGTNFEEAWSDTAEQTLKEKGNRIYSLRKVATDNTHYYTYGTWDSYGDLSDHLNSKHFDRLHDWAGSKDIVWYMSPMEHIAHSKEGGGGDSGSDDSDAHSST